MQNSYDKLKNDDIELIFDSDESMPSTERELADDAQWKIIQKNTFTRWVNVHLKNANTSITDLQNDFCDGLKLMALIEVLSGHKFTHVNKRTNFRTQKLENVTMALKFLEEKEKIRLVNIDSSDIVDGRLKLILGLIWILILHYSISMPVWDGDDSKEETKQTPKQRMMSWIHTKLPDTNIRNLTTDWNDGIAIGALVDSCAPGLCPDWTEWKPSNALNNTREAMDTAEQWLEVPQLIKPEEMIDPNVDEKAMMTYLSQFPNAKLKPGAPLRPKLNPNKVRIYGPGIESNELKVGEETQFTVDAVSAGKGELNIDIVKSNGEKIKPKIIEKQDKPQCFTCYYTPQDKDKYTISVNYADKEVPRSPFTVKIDKSPLNISKVKVYGPGVEQDGVLLNMATHFIVDTKDAGDGQLECFIQDPKKKKNTVSPVIKPNGDDKYKVEYKSSNLGVHMVNILYAGQKVPNSPFPVNIAPRSDARMVKVSGRGLQTNGIRVGDNALFYVDTAQAGEGKLDLKMLDSDKKQVPIKTKEIKPNYYQCLYIPAKTGQYELSIDYDSLPISRSPFKINVLPDKKTKIRAYGPGLKTGVINKPAIFTVDTNKEEGTLGFAIEGPSKANIECCDNQDGSATVCYWPTVEGEYAVHITTDGVDIPDSPYMSEIVSQEGKSDVSSIKVSGLGVTENKVFMDKMNEFTIDCSKYDEFDQHKPVVSCFTGTGEEVKVLSNLQPGSKKYTCRYQPQKSGNLKIFVTCDDQSVDKSPYKAIVPKPPVPENVRVIGEGIKQATRYQSGRFSVDITSAGKGVVTVEILDELGNQIPLKISNETDYDIYDIEYNPQTAGPEYQCSVFFNGLNVPKSPFKIKILPDIDVSGVYVENLEQIIYQQSFVRFVVNAKSIDKTGKGTVKAIFTDFNGYKSASMVKNMGDGTYNCTFSPYEAGNYQLDVTYENLPVANSPFDLDVIPGCDINRIKVYGDGLEGGYTNKPNLFTIDLDGAGQGNLGLAIEGPADAKISCIDNMDGTCKVEYTSELPGIYDIIIKFNDEDILDSPFKVPIRDPINPKNVKLFGAAYDPKATHRVGKPITFMIDAIRAGEAPLDVSFKDEQGKEIPVKIKQRENAMPGLYEATVTPEKTGHATLDVRFDDTRVDNSPMSLNVLPTYEPNKVKLSGEGIFPASGYNIPNKSVEFKIDTTKSGDGDIELAVKNPEGLEVKCKVFDEGNGILTCNYTPVEAGVHTVNVLFNGKALPKCPVPVKVSPVGNASKCFIEEEVPEYILTGSEVVITVNTAKAGEGKLHCTVIPVSKDGITLSDAEPLAVDIEDNGNGTHSIYYSLYEIGTYDVDIKYGGVHIPKGTFSQNALDSINMPEETIKMEKSEDLHSAVSNGFSNSINGMYPVTFRFPYSGDNIEAYVITPNGKKDDVNIEKKKNGKVKISYVPQEKGMHELIVNCDGKPIKGSPFNFFAESMGIGKVAAYGPGLSHGQTGLPAEFTIVTKDAGAGGLSLAIEGPSKAEIVCRDNENGTCDVTYYPLIPGEYSIVIKFADQNIAGSPFLATIIGDPQRKSQICIGSTSDVPLKIQNLDISTLTASVRAPSGKEEPCILKRMPNENLGISFTPKEVGDHYINVYQSGSHIVGSPFQIAVGENEIGDASKVRVYGDGLKRGQASEMNYFTVDTREAGYGGLSLSIEGPSKAEIECKDNHDGSCEVSYIPGESGTYMINIKYANEHVMGSPFAVKIVGDSSAKLMEKIIRKQEAADITQVGSQCELTLKIPGTNVTDMRATVKNQSGKTEVCEIKDLYDGHYSIKFVPKEMGLHTVVVQHKGAHIPGSPFQFTVGPIVDGGAHKVIASGPGLKDGFLGQSNEFQIYTREAGAGGLSIALEGPSKAEISFEDKKDGSCTVKYTVSEPGEYLCNVKFNEDHILNSPFRIYVRDSKLDYVSMTNIGQAPDRDLMIGKPAALTVSYRQSSSACSERIPKLKAVVFSPSGKQESGMIQSLEKNQYAIRFIPKESGEHYINVTDEANGGKHISGSPFRICVNQNIADPTMVKAYGEGLIAGSVGSKNTFLVNTTEAGSGALNVTVDGPSKVQLYSKEIDEGYQFVYVPTVPGDYTVTIKYGGNYHIAGSPFIAHIKGSKMGGVDVEQHEQSHLQLDTISKTQNIPTASRPSGGVPDNSKALKVHCFGDGLKKAHLNRINSFTVDATEAGSDILFVGVAGPRSQCEEVSVKRINYNQFVVNYKVQEKGRHFLIIKWGDYNIPGSPVVIDVV